MLTRLWPGSRRPVPAPRTVSLVLERLEVRDCPAAPQITLAAVVQAGHQVELTGKVADETPAGMMVNFTGAVNGSTRTDASGYYRYVTSTANLGTVTAQAFDMTEMLMSNRPT